MKFIEVVCPICGKKSYVSMTNEEFERYSNNDDLIQNIFPNWSPEDRELLITGMCNDCQQEIFNY